MTDDLIKEIKVTYSVLLQTLSRYEADEMDIIPFEGSWTAGQVAEHIIKSGSGICGFLQGPTEPTHRPIDQKVATIKSVFLDFTIKMQSPDFILPTQTSHHKDAQVNTLESIRNELLQAATLDLSHTCTGFELPGIGMLTRLEWLYFNCFHTQRHIRQLGNIFQALRYKAA
jgi:hypothetical protein